MVAKMVRSVMRGGCVLEGRETTDKPSNPMTSRCRKTTSPGMAAPGLSKKFLSGLGMGLPQKKSASGQSLSLSQASKTEHVVKFIHILIRTYLFVALDM